MREREREGEGERVAESRCQPMRHCREEQLGTERLLLWTLQTYLWIHSQQQAGDKDERRVGGR